MLPPSMSRWSRSKEAVLRACFDFRSLSTCQGFGQAGRRNCGRLLVNDCNPSYQHCSVNMCNEGACSLNSLRSKSSCTLVDCSKYHNPVAAGESQTCKDAVLTAFQGGRVKGKMLCGFSYSALYRESHRDISAITGILRRLTSPWYCAHSLSTASALTGKDSTDSFKTSFAAIELALNSVVKVFTVASSPNYFLPWQNKPQREVTGSGFVIRGQRIITNAHIVADQTFVKVRKHGCPEKFKAKVEAVGHECDLALLSVGDDEFWDGICHLELGDIPHLQESVAVVGYPQGGDNISVTGGVVSRVEPTQYVHGGAHLMAIQIDAAINPGNSGGPALMGDRVVGVAFQNLANAENIGYIIPVPIISHFLADVEEKGMYIGFCSLGLTCQATENSHLRDHLKMPLGLTGVLVVKLHPLTDTCQWIKKHDVLLAFDGITIANDGTVHFRNRERILFDHLVSMKKSGETGLLRILRDGQQLEFLVKLGPIRRLVPIHQFDNLPSYFIFVGLVFTPLTFPYLHEYGEDWYNTSPRQLCEKAFHTIPTRFGEQIVILSQILVDDVNAGYERFADQQVTKVNGVEILNLQHLKQLVEGCKEKRICFDLDDKRMIVFDFETARDASLRILNRHRIPSAMSKDLMEEMDPEDLLQDWEKADNVLEQRNASAGG
eukprot:c27134_g1_i1 orf=414-2402(-)